jgi:hypothetical protein
MFDGCVAESGKGKPKAEKKLADKKVIFTFRKE